MKTAPLKEVSKSTSQDQTKCPVNFDEIVLEDEPFLNESLSISDFLLHPENDRGGLLDVSGNKFKMDNSHISTADSPLEPPVASPQISLAQKPDLSKSVSIASINAILQRNRTSQTKSAASVMNNNKNPVMLEHSLQAWMKEKGVDNLNPQKKRRMSNQHNNEQQIQQFGNILENSSNNQYASLMPFSPHLTESTISPLALPSSPTTNTSFTSNVAQTPSFQKRFHSSQHPLHAPSLLNLGQASNYSIERLPYPDITTIRSKLVDIICGEPDLEKFCAKATTLICQSMSMMIGGFYLNERQNMKDWTMYYAFPTLSVFTTFFSWNSGYHLILQAAAEKRCFSVNNLNGELCYLFVPVTADTGNSVAVWVLATQSKGDMEIQTLIVWLEQIRRPIATALVSLRCMQQNALLIDRLQTLNRENELFRQRNRFDNSLIALLSTVTAPDIIIICMDFCGIITYFSPGAEVLLGYTTHEVLGRMSILDMHVQDEIQDRSTELEIELGRKVEGFLAIVDTTYRTGVEETRKWTFKRKDLSTVQVSLSIKSLYDDTGHAIGFVGIARAI